MTIDSPDLSTSPTGAPGGASERLSERYNEGIVPAPPPLRVEMLLPRRPVPLPQFALSPRAAAVLALVLILCAVLSCALLGGLV